jgi:sterol desaturase/sphingolipid hydroxylase (fatty acid hydroxylase superfamily)
MKAAPVHGSIREGPRPLRGRLGRLRKPAVGGLLLAGWFGALVWLERRHALRRREVEPKLRRDARNLAMAGASAAVVQGLEMPVVRRVAALAERRRWGLLRAYRLPRGLETALAVVLLDYTLYLWHVLTHRVPGLWRFHRVHHCDLDMDASTALRFHFGEIAISVAYRSAQVAAIGVSPRALELWQKLLFASILFHHSNLRLPLAWERWLARVVVTPRLHAIHHSAAAEDVNSNWSSGLTVWDWLHGTLRTGVPQEAIRIGLPELTEPEQVALSEIVAMPFREAAEVIGPHLPGHREPLAHLQP